MFSKTFKEFVMEQPADREIDHAGGWSSCAVGDYVESEGQRRLSFDYDKEIVAGIVEDEKLYDSLNNNGRTFIDAPMFVDMSNMDKIIDTYGDIQEYYKGNIQITYEQ